MSFTHPELERDNVVQNLFSKKQKEIKGKYEAAREGSLGIGTTHQEPASELMGEQKLQTQSS